MGEYTILEDRGRVTIPAPVRDAMGWKPGTQIRLAITPEGDISLSSYPAKRRPLSAS